MSIDTLRSGKPSASHARSSRLRARLLSLAGPLLAAAAVLPAAGCGLAGTAATAATGAASEAQQAKQARAIEDHVKQQLNDAARAAAQQREAAEKAAQ